MKRPVLGRKQTADNAEFVRFAENVEAFISRDEVESVAAKTVERLAVATAGVRSAFAWSGGKDSVALAEVCRRAGIFDCVMGMSDLEYPAFLAWVTDHMPNGLTVINTHVDLAWLLKRPHCLFPQTAGANAEWFGAIQWRAQREYAAQRRLDVMVLGRRVADGNQCGRDGWKRPGGRAASYAAIYDWSHEQVIGFNYYNRLPCPPIYGWPNGFVAGTCPWPGRLFTGSVREGWRQTWEIDPSLVRLGATHFESARAFLAETGGR